MEISKFSSEELDDFAMRMSWAMVPEDTRNQIRQMAAAALTVARTMTTLADLGEDFRPDK